MQPDSRIGGVFRGDFKNSFCSGPFCSGPFVQTAFVQIAFVQVAFVQVAFVQVASWQVAFAQALSCKLFRASSFVQAPLCERRLLKWRLLEWRLLEWRFREWFRALHRVAPGTFRRSNQRSDAIPRNDDPEKQNGLQNVLAYFNKAGLDGHVAEWLRSGLQS
jgi:hypothetical protein